MAPVFNNKEVEVDFAFSEELDDDDDCTYILTVARSGDELKRHYASTKSHFTQAYERCSRSDQNDRRNFSDFCGLTSSSTSLSSIGKK